MATTTFSRELKLKRADVNTALDEFFASTDVSMYSRHGQEAWTHLKDFSSRPGKRIRGSLLLTAYEMYGGTNRDEALKAAVAIELIQNYLLIVDDVMDRSTIRRTKPAVQYIYYERIKALTRDDYHHIGDMLAINVGLLANHVASQLMNELQLPAESIVVANKKFQENIKNTTYGQIDDLYSGVEHTTEEDILLTHELKSSYYTFINPMQVGALLAGAGESEIAELRDFGLPAGIAFQLQDDILGLFGNDDVTGKSYLDDLKEGKYTLIMQQAFERADKPGVVTILEALGNQEIDETHAAAVRKVVIDCGAKKYADERAQGYAHDAKKIIKQSNWPAEHKVFLDELMDYILERLK